MHAMVHSPIVSETKKKTYDEMLWEGLSEETCRKQLGTKNSTIIWDIWHITRIEDLTSAVLIKNERQTLDTKWLRKINTSIKDTGNAMTGKEIAEFSEQIVIQELRNYRIEVGKRTQRTISELTEEEMYEKVEKDRINRILDEGGVLPKKESIWLLDFWGRKTISGLLLMPITRHQIVHINDAMRIKEKYEGHKNPAINNIQQHKPRHTVS